jgi:hypothetical protein
MEKVVSEWRVVETDDGYRVEVKGDKRALRHWAHSAPWQRMRRPGRFGFGPGHGFWRHCEPETDEPASDELE